MSFLGVRAAPERRPSLRVQRGSVSHPSTDWSATLRLVRTPRRYPSGRLCPPGRSRSVQHPTPLVLPPIRIRAGPCRERHHHTIPSSPVRAPLPCEFVPPDPRGDRGLARIIEIVPYLPADTVDVWPGRARILTGDVCRAHPRVVGRPGLPLEHIRRGYVFRGASRLSLSSCEVRHPLIPTAGSHVFNPSNSGCPRPSDPRITRVEAARLLGVSSTAG